VACQGADPGLDQRRFQPAVAFQILQDGLKSPRRPSAAMLRCSAPLLPRVRYMSASGCLDSTLATGTGNWVISGRSCVAPCQQGVQLVS
jgi:hypothetical protein